MVVPRFAFLLVLVLFSGCAAQRQALMDTGAGLVGRTQAPASVGGLDYAGMRAIDALRDECLVLHDVHRRQGYLAAHDIETWLLPACRAIIRRQQALIAEEQAIAEFMAREWAIVQHRVEQIRREEDRRRREQRAREARQQQEAERITRLRESIHEARIQRILDEQDVQDNPLAHTQGQSTEITLRTFLACVELAYPNAGYRVERDARTLSVMVKRAQLPRGEVPIEARFTEYPNAWLLSYLKVADIEPRSAADRYVLAENLLAEHCHSESGIFAGEAGH